MLQPENETNKVTQNGNLEGKETKKGHWPLRRMTTTHWPLLLESEHLYEFDNGKDRLRKGAKRRPKSIIVSHTMIMEEIFLLRDH